MDIENQTLDKVGEKAESVLAEKSEKTFVSEEGKISIQKENPIFVRDQMSKLKQEIDMIKESQDKVRSAQAYGLEEAALPQDLVANAKLSLEEKIQQLQELKEINNKQNKGAVRKFLSLFSF